MTGYRGEHDGMSYSSLYRNLYRVQYHSRIGHRGYDVDRIVTAMDEHHARERAQGSFGATIIGSIDVECVGALEPVS